MTCVLLVDADQDFRSLLATALRSRHSQLEVREASSGSEAEEACSQSGVDLLVVEGSLPDQPGVHVVRRVRALGCRPRVILVSALKRDLKAAERPTQDEVSMVVYKPISVEGFAETILALVADQQAGVSPDHGALFAQLSALKQRFAAKLPARLTELEDAVAQAQVDRREVPTAKTMAHRLRGSAGSYGHPTVGEIAGRVEDLLGECEAVTGPVRPYYWRAIDEALREARWWLAQDANHTPHLEGHGDQRPALLVVDDDPDFLELATRIGASKSLRVVTAQSAPEALRWARTVPLLGAILDVYLHDQTSFTLAQQLRGLKGNQLIPIAFASVDHSLETRVTAIEAGGVRFFEKPLSEETFASLAYELINLANRTEGRVLIVDDDPEVVEHYALHLRAAGIRVDSQASPERIVEVLEDLRPDVLLLDVNLPTVSGLDVCQALRMSAHFELLPILMITARTDDETRLRAFRAGASDVVAKPVIPEELLARVGVQLDRTRLLRERADKDVLSGLLLRRSLHDAFERVLAISTRDRKPLSMVLLDLDHFKQINDTHGHLAGDEVIAQLGALLQRRFRVEDLRGRWGGEEFVLVFPGQSADFAERAALRLLDEFRGLSFSGDGGASFSATFTAGVAAFPEDGSSVSALIHRADKALYEGKRLGRNRVCRRPRDASSPPSRERS